MSDVTPGPADQYKSSASYRGAKAAVILLGILLAIAFLLLIVGFAVKLGRKSGADAAPVRFTLAHGAKILSTEVSGNRLIIHVKSSAGEEIDIIDTQDGHLVGQVKPQAR